MNTFASRILSTTHTAANPDGEAIEAITKVLGKWDSKRQSEGGNGEIFKWTRSVQQYKIRHVTLYCNDAIDLSIVAENRKIYVHVTETSWGKAKQKLAKIAKQYENKPQAQFVVEFINELLSI